MKKRRNRGYKPTSGRPQYASDDGPLSDRAWRVLQRRQSKQTGRLRGFLLSPYGEAAERQVEARRKRELGLFDWSELTQLTFPGYYTVFFDYGATGEGVTRGLMMCWAGSADYLKGKAYQDFGEFYAAFSEIRRGLAPPPGYENLVPPKVQRIVDVIQGKREGLKGMFHFSAKVHENYA